ncbi:MAG: hypothetical protein ABI399_09180 [Bauldia sp.]
MSQLLERYRQYRQVGFRRIDAFHFAWLVVMSGARPATIRLPRH